MTSSSMPSVAHAHSRVGLAAVAGIGIYRPAAGTQLARRVSGTDVTGVSYRVQAQSGVTTASLAAGAARAALRAAAADPRQVEMIVVGTTTPDVLWPSTACLVQTELQLPMVAAFDLYAAQASFLTALNVMTRYVAAGTRSVLLIGAESDNQLVDLPGQGSMVRGRAAAAAMLQPVGRGSAILATVAGGVAAAGTAVPNGPEGAMLRGIEEAARQCLEKAGIALGQVDLVIGDQASPELMRLWAKQSRVPLDRLLLDEDRYGALLAAAPLIALHDAVADGRVNGGATVLLLESGSGPVWAAACLQWGDTGVAEC